MKFCHEFKWCQQSFTLSHILPQNGEAAALQGAPGSFLLLKSLFLILLVTRVLDRGRCSGDLPDNYTHAAWACSPPHSHLGTCFLLWPNLPCAHSLCPKRFSAWEGQWDSRHSELQGYFLVILCKPGIWTWHQFASSFLTLTRNEPWGCHRGTRSGIQMTCIWQLC